MAQPRHDFCQYQLCGHAPGVFPEPYTWRNYAKLNEDFTAHYQYTTLREARDLLDISHHQILDLIESFTNEKLFTKKYFTWTGTTSLSSYFVSSTSSHYE
ncbi:ClbS/DfsB family four-helix bundle protein [Schaalia turicensis]|uniref:ClbS/DfsB family four-helix bundle protein n=1 Tax=Schaalia turicensis TaxID=131111 RepID=UPI003FA45DF6